MIPYNEKTMVIVLYAIRQTGLVSPEELSEYLKEHLETEIEDATLYLCLRRWKAKGAFVIEKIDDVNRYKIAKLPAWFESLKMSNLMKVTVREAKEHVKELDEFFGGGTDIVETKGKYGDFKRFALTFETVDPILGGYNGKKDDEKVLPRRDGKVIVPTNWMKGWLRSNAALFRGTGSIQHHVGMSAGAFIEEVTPMSVTAIVKRVGEVRYEAIPPKMAFEATWRFPFKGTKIREPAHLKEFLEVLGVDPIRGLGANPNVCGGRVKLIGMEELPSLSFMS